MEFPTDLHGMPLEMTAKLVNYQ